MIRDCTNGFFADRWHSRVDLGVLFWRDMIVVGTLINLVSGFAALILFTQNAAAALALEAVHAAGFAGRRRLVRGNDGDLNVRGTFIVHKQLIARHHVSGADQGITNYECPFTGASCSTCDKSQSRKARLRGRSAPSAVVTIQ